MPRMRKFEYLVSQAQFGRVTFENGEWIGTPMDSGDPDLDSCPFISDYLNELGAEGWELVACTVNNMDTGADSTPLEKLFLKRQMT